MEYRFCILYFSKTKRKPAKKITGQCCLTEMEVACEKSANLEQETKATKIVTYPLFPLASSTIHLSVGGWRIANMGRENVHSSRWLVWVTDVYKCWIFFFLTGPCCAGN